MTTAINRRAFVGGAVVSLNLAAIAAQALAQEATGAASPPPERPGLETYVKLPLIQDVSLSPNGERIALITRPKDVNILLIYDIATQKARQIPLGEGKIRGIFWGSNDNVMITTTQTVGLEQFTGSKQEHRLVINFDLRTGKMKPLFNRMDGYYNTVEGNVQRIRLEDGKYYVTASNYDMKGYEYPLNLFRFDLDTGKGRQIDTSVQETENWVLTPAGVPVARAFYFRDSKKWVLEFRTEKGGWRKAYEQKEAIDYPSLIGLGRSEKTVIVYIDAGDKGGNYYEVSADGTFSEPLNGEARVTPLFHPQTGLFCGFASYDDWVSYDYSDPQLKRLAGLAVKAMPDYNVSIYEFAAENPRRVLLYGESPNDPGSYYFIDFGTGNYVQVGENYPDLPSEWVTQKQKMSYKATDGLEIHGYLTLPPFREAKNLPLVVHPHGGPNARDRSDFDWEVQLYASRGYAVFQPNFRGSTGYGEAFVEAGYGQWGRKMQTDLSDGVRHLAAAGTIDPRRVCIVGASYGGYAALAGVTLDPGVYNCAVSVAGVSDLKAMLDFDQTKSGAANSPLVLYMKRSVGDRKTLDEISPIRHADKVGVPVLLVHGRDDTVVEVAQSRRMEKALKSAGKDVTYIELEGEDHWQSVESSRLDMAKAIIGFIEKYNPPTRA